MDDGENASENGTGLKICTTSEDDDAPEQKHSSTLKTVSENSESKNYNQTRVFQNFNDAHARNNNQNHASSQFCNPTLRSLHNNISVPQHNPKVVSNPPYYQPVGSDWTQCHICSKKFKNYQLLYNHMYSHDPKPPGKKQLEHLTQLTKQLEQFNSNSFIPANTLIPANQITNQISKNVSPFNQASDYRNISNISLSGTYRYQIQTEIQNNKFISTRSRPNPAPDRLKKQCEFCKKSYIRLKNHQKSCKQKKLDSENSVILPSFNYDRSEQQVLDAVRVIDIRNNRHSHRSPLKDPETDGANSASTTSTPTSAISTPEIQVTSTPAKKRKLIEVKSKRGHFVCSQCDQAFKSSKVLKSHKLICKKRDFRSSRSNINISQRSSLRIAQVESERGVVVPDVVVPLKRKSDCEIEVNGGRLASGDKSKLNETIHELYSGRKQLSVVESNETGQNGENDSVAVDQMVKTSPSANTSPLKICENEVRVPVCGKNEAITKHVTNEENRVESSQNNEVLPLETNKNNKEKTFPTETEPKPAFETSDTDQAKPTKNLNTISIESPKNNNTFEDTLTKICDAFKSNSSTDQNEKENHRIEKEALLSKIREMERKQKQLEENNKDLKEQVQLKDILTEIVSQNEAIIEENGMIIAGNCEASEGKGEAEVEGDRSTINEEPTGNDKSAENDKPAENAKTLENGDSVEDEKSDVKIQKSIEQDEKDSGFGEVTVVARINKPPKECLKIIKLGNRPKTPNWNRVLEYTQKPTRYVKAEVLK